MSRNKRARAFSLDVEAVGCQLLDGVMMHYTSTADDGPGGLAQLSERSSNAPAWIRKSTSLALTLARW